MIAPPIALTRLPLLYLRSRNIWQTLGALSLMFALLIIAFEDRMNSLRNQTMALLGLTALLTCIILVSVWSPFGEPERTSPGGYRRMRALHLALTMLVAFTAGGVWVNSLPNISESIDLPWVFVRNTFAYIGIALIAARRIDCRLAALIPLVLIAPSLAVAIALPLVPIPGWNYPWWNIFGQDQHHIWANIICLLLGAVGIGSYIDRGVEDTLDQ